jgi:hypothetical protein
MMAPDNPQRFQNRVPFAARLMVLQGNSAWFVQLHDLSEGGCGVFRPQHCTLEEEQVVRLFFHYEDGAPAVVVPARVARVTATQIGIEYHEPQAIPPAPPAR